MRGELSALQVWAVDASEEQLKQCQPHPKILFRRGFAESTGVPSGSIDLMTVATALHWCAALHTCMFLSGTLWTISQTWSSPQRHTDCGLCIARTFLYASSVHELCKAPCVACT